MADSNFSRLLTRFLSNVWGTSFSGDKLIGDFGNEFGALFIGDRSNCFLTKNSLPNNFGLLQLYRPQRQSLTRTPRIDVA
jgi:hypothetical protein